MDLEEYRRKKAESSSKSFVKFTEDGETRYLRFLDPNPAANAHLKTFDPDKKKYLYDAAIPDNYDGKVSVVLRLSAVEYDQGGANPRNVIWEFSEFLYNKFAKSYIEDPDNGAVPDNVWKVKAVTPKTLDCSYAFIQVKSTLESYPIPKKAVKDEGETGEEAEAPKAEKKDAPKPVVRKSGYFD